MKELEINEKTFHFKDKVEEITIEEFINIMDILRNETLGNVQKIYYLILELTDMDEEEMEDMTEEQFEMFDVSFIENIMGIVKTEEIKPYIEIDGIKYGYDVEENRTIRMVIDINYYRTEYLETDALIYLLAILLRPIETEIDILGYYEIEKYNYRKMLSRKEIIKKGKATELYPLLDFFFNG